MTHHRSDGIAARAAAALAGAALLQGALAGPPAGLLTDPTRPPAALSAPGGLAAAALPHQANRDTARAIAAAQRAAEPPPPPPAPPLVQAVQLPTPGSAAGAAVALVDGRLVKTGAQIDGRTVLAIDAQGLLVQSPGGRSPERLWLLGGAPKLAAGSITQSQTARYQAPAADANEAQATGPAPVPAGTTSQSTSPITSQPTSPTGNPSTAAAALSLANALGKRTAP